MEYCQPKIIFSIEKGISTPLSLYDCTMNKFRGIFVRVLVDNDMIYALPNQILVERPDFVFIANIQFEKLPTFFCSCKRIGFDISKCRRHYDNLNNTIKLSTILSKLVLEYKFVTIQTKETNDVTHKEVVGVIEK